MIVAVNTESGFTVGSPREIAAGNFGSFGVAPDGQRFLVLKTDESPWPGEIRVVEGALEDRDVD